MTEHTLRIEVENSDTGLTKLVDGFRQFADHHRLPARIQHDIQLVLDEVVANVFRHAYVDRQPHQIVVDVALGPGVLKVEVIDDGRPFDPVQRARPRTDQKIAERPIGGLGIHLVKQVMDELEYSRRDGLNHLVLKKRIDESC